MQMCIRDSVYPITVLPLRMRRADIIPLAKYFVERYNLEFGLQKSLGAKALEFLENQSFRGNIRELQNLIQRLMIMTNNRIIEARDVLQVLSMDSVEPVSYTHLVWGDPLLPAEHNPASCSATRLRTVLFPAWQTAVRKVPYAAPALRLALLHSHSRAGHTGFPGRVP